MKINVNQEELLRLSRYSYLSEHNKVRWLFSFNDLYLKDFLLYNKLFKLELSKFNVKYNPNNKEYILNFANHFIDIKE